MPLTGNNQERSRTYAGQASFGIAANRRCHECRFFENEKYRATYNGKCRKTADLGLHNAPAFPSSAFACKYFEPKDQPGAKP